MTIDTITGDLRAVARLEKGTLQHWDELSLDQIHDATLRDKWFYVADFPLYTAAGGTPTLYLARHTAEHPKNLVLNHLFDEENSSYHQLIKTGNFCPDLDEARMVVEAVDTLRIELSGLRLSGNDTKYRHLRIRTEDGFVKGSDDNYQRPNEVEQALMQRVGYTEEFLGVLQSKPHKGSETRIYCLNPDYVQAEAGEQFVGRAAWRDYFSLSASSYAVGHNVNVHDCLRGVRREVAPQLRAPEKGQVM